MSSLEKSISNFEKELSKRNVFTEDDISELESHIIDKVEDLKQGGLNEDDAFNKTISDLGPIDEIAAEYSKVNLSPKMKFTLLCFGYFAINLMMSIIYVISVSASYFTQNIESEYYYECSTPLESLYNGDPNYPALFILLINISLVLLLLYFIRRKNNNLLSIISDKVLIIHNSKTPVKIAASLSIVTIPFLLNIMIASIFNKLSNNMTFAALQNNYNCLFVSIVLTLFLIVQYMKSKSSNSASSYMILGYSIITIAARFIPALALSGSIAIGQFNPVFITILFIILFMSTCCVVGIISRKGILERKPSIIYAPLLLICFIGSYVILQYSMRSIDYTILSESMSILGNLSYALSICLNLLAAAALFSNNRISLLKKHA